MTVKDLIPGDRMIVRSSGWVNNNPAGCEYVLEAEFIRVNHIDSFDYDRVWLKLIKPLNTTHVPFTLGEHSWRVENILWDETEKICKLKNFNEADRPDVRSILDI